MSLSIALSHALSGLKVNSQQAEITSTNVANALTPGYARREAVVIEAIAGGASAGARVIGIDRAMAESLDAKRLADADSARASTLSEAAARLADKVGAPGEAGALATAAADMVNAFALAADTPESRAFLDQASRAAGGFATAITTVAAEAQTLRNEADAAIATKIEQINVSLTRIKSLNSEIQTRSLQGEDFSALADERARLVESVSKEIPVRALQRDNDQIALYARNGGQLLDGRIAEIAFTPTPAIGPGQTLAGGALSPFTVDGRDIPIGSGDGGGLYDGGGLSALFHLRDVLLPTVQGDIDAIAEDAILRTQGLAADPTLGPTDAGLFTDAGAAYDPSDRIGLALRISLNAAVDISAGGDSSLLRDGLLAVGPGETGNAVTLVGLVDAFEAPVASPAGARLTGIRSLTGFSEEMSTILQTSASTLGQDAAFEAAKATTLADAVAIEQSVDSDQELSKLLVIERAYAANARVVNVIDEMLEDLLTL